MDIENEPEITETTDDMIIIDINPPNEQPNLLENVEIVNLETLQISKNDQYNISPFVENLGIDSTNIENYFTSSFMNDIEEDLPIIDISEIFSVSRRGATHETTEKENDKEVCGHNKENNNNNDEDNHNKEEKCSNHEKENSVQTQKRPNKNKSNINEQGKESDQEKENKILTQKSDYENETNKKSDNKNKSNEDEEEKKTDQDKEKKIPTKHEKNKLHDAFANHLMYPEPIKRSKNTNRTKNERAPSAISSDRWREYYKKKDEEKEQKKMEIEKRKEERKKIKESKEEKKIVKKYKQKPIRKTNNTKENLNNREKIPCSLCKNTLNSDTEEEDNKNIGCDNCDKWFHKKCTEFYEAPYSIAAAKEYKCDMCEVSF